jgi:flagellar biosynthesis anti-sigma factor FlgM
MRIDPNQGAQALPQSERAGSQGVSPGAAGAAASSGLGEDQAELSGTHVQVQALAAQALQLPEIRQEKVNALRPVVQEGNYQPGSDQIAEAVFQHMLAMLAA